jgi:hypothetical protein
MYALIDISNQMLEDSAFDMECEIRGEATERFAVKDGAEIRGLAVSRQRAGLGCTPSRLHGRSAHPAHGPGGPRQPLSAAAPCPSLVRISAPVPPMRCSPNCSAIHDQKHVHHTCFR